MAYLYHEAALRPAHTEPHNVTLTGGTFDLFDGHCDRQNGLHTHLPVMNIVFFPLTATFTLDVNRLLWKRIPVIQYGCGWASFTRETFTLTRTYERPQRVQPVKAAEIPSRVVPIIHRILSIITMYKSF